MDRTPVSSKNIASIGYEDGILEIEFNSGGIYQYDGVPKEVYSSLIDAKSIGSYFHHNIRDRYPTTKVG